MEDILGGEDEGVAWNCPTRPHSEAAWAAKEAARPGQCSGAGAGLASPFGAAGYRYRQASAFTFFTT